VQIKPAVSYVELSQTHAVGGQFELQMATGTLARDTCHLMQMPWDATRVLIAVGRFLLGSLFVLAGLRHLSILDILSDAIRQRGVRWSRGLLIAGTALQILCGACLMLGLCVVWAAAGLVLFTVAAGLLVLNFWDMEGEERSESIEAWQRNVALIGGLLLAAASALHGP
jgi:putative oxidoreductase